jgi:hypothetical protein
LLATIVTLFKKPLLRRKKEDWTTWARCAVQRVVVGDAFLSYCGFWLSGVALIGDADIEFCNLIGGGFIGNRKSYTFASSYFVHKVIVAVGVLVNMPSPMRLIPFRINPVMMSSITLSLTAHGANVS